MKKLLYENLKEVFNSRTFDLSTRIYVKMPENKVFNRSLIEELINGESEISILHYLQDLSDDVVDFFIKKMCQTITICIPALSKKEDIVFNIMKILWDLTAQSQISEIHSVLLSKPLLQLTVKMGCKISITKKTVYILNRLFESESVIQCVMNDGFMINKFMLLADKVFEVGDFECQASLIELMLRITNANGKEQWAELWFSMEDFKSQFLSLSSEQFEFTSRRFLNSINSSKYGRKVYSFIACSIVFDDVNLIEPCGSDLWVDFNYNSKSISFCCRELVEAESNNQELWETIGVSAHDVSSCFLNVGPENQSKELVIMLKCPCSRLVTMPSESGSKGNIIKIYFQGFMDVHPHLEFIYGSAYIGCRLVVANQLGVAKYNGPTNVKVSQSMPVEAENLDEQGYQITSHQPISDASHSDLTNRKVSQSMPVDAENLDEMDDQLSSHQPIPNASSCALTGRKISQSMPIDAEILDEMDDQLSSHQLISNTSGRKVSQSMPIDAESLDKENSDSAPSESLSQQDSNQNINKLENDPDHDQIEENINSGAIDKDEVSYEENNISSNKSNLRKSKRKSKKNLDCSQNRRKSSTATVPDFNIEEHYNDYADDVFVQNSTSQPQKRKQAETLLSNESEDCMKELPENNDQNCSPIRSKTPTSEIIDSFINEMVNNEEQYTTREILSQISKNQRKTSNATVLEVISMEKYDNRTENFDETDISQSKRRKTSQSAAPNNEFEETCNDVGKYSKNPTSSQYQRKVSNSEMVDASNCDLSHDKNNSTNDIRSNKNRHQRKSSNATVSDMSSSKDNYDNEADNVFCAENISQSKKRKSSKALILNEFEDTCVQNLNDSKNRDCSQYYRNASNSEIVDAPNGDLPYHDENNSAINSQSGRNRNQRKSSNATVSDVSRGKVNYDNGSENVSKSKKRKSSQAVILNENEENHVEDVGDLKNNCNKQRHKLSSSENIDASEDHLMNFETENANTEVFSDAEYHTISPISKVIESNKADSESGSLNDSESSCFFASQNISKQNHEAAKREKEYDRYNTSSVLQAQKQKNSDAVVDCVEDGKKTCLDEKDNDSKKTKKKPRGFLWKLMENYYQNEHDNAEGTASGKKNNETISKASKVKKSEHRGKSNILNEELAPSDNQIGDSMVQKDVFDALKSSVKVKKTAGQASCCQGSKNHTCHSTSTIQNLLQIGKTVKTPIRNRKENSSKNNSLEMENSHLKSTPPLLSRDPIYQEELILEETVPNEKVSYLRSIDDNEQLDHDSSTNEISPTQAVKNHSTFYASHRENSDSNENTEAEDKSGKGASKEIICAATSNGNRKHSATNVKAVYSQGFHDMDDEVSHQEADLAAEIGSCSGSEINKINDMDSDFASENIGRDDPQLDNEYSFELEFDKLVNQMPTKQVDSKKSNDTSPKKKQTKSKGKSSKKDSSMHDTLPNNVDHLKKASELNAAEKPSTTVKSRKIRLYNPDKAPVCSVDLNSRKSKKQFQKDELFSVVIPSEDEVSKELDKNESTPHSSHRGKIQSKTNSPTSKSGKLPTGRFSPNIHQEVNDIYEKDNDDFVASSNGMEKKKSTTKTNGSFYDSGICIDENKSSSTKSQKRKSRKGEVEEQTPGSTNARNQKSRKAAVVATEKNSKLMEDNYDCYDDIDSDGSVYKPVKRERTFWMNVPDKKFYPKGFKKAGESTDTAESEVSWFTKKSSSFRLFETPKKDYTLEKGRKPNQKPSKVTQRKKRTSKSNASKIEGQKANSEQIEKTNINSKPEKIVQWSEFDNYSLVEEKKGQPDTYYGNRILKDFDEKIKRSFRDSPVNTAIPETSNPQATSRLLNSLPSTDTNPSESLHVENVLENDYDQDNFPTGGSNVHDNSFQDCIESEIKDSSKMKSKPTEPKPNKFKQSKHSINTQELLDQEESADSRRCVKDFTINSQSDNIAMDGNVTKPLYCGFEIGNLENLRQFSPAEYEALTDEANGKEFLLQRYLEEMVSSSQISRSSQHENFFKDIYYPAQPAEDGPLYYNPLKRRNADPGVTGKKRTKKQRHSRHKPYEEQVTSRKENILESMNEKRRLFSKMLDKSMKNLLHKKQNQFSVQSDRQKSSMNSERSFSNKTYDSRISSTENPLSFSDGPKSVFDQSIFSVLSHELKKLNRQLIGTIQKYASDFCKKLTLHRESLLKVTETLSDQDLAVIERHDLIKYQKECRNKRIHLQNSLKKIQEFAAEYFEAESKCDKKLKQIQKKASKKFTHHVQRAKYSAEKLMEKELFSQLRKHMAKFRMEFL